MLPQVNLPTGEDVWLRYLHRSLFLTCVLFSFGLVRFLFCFAFFFFQKGILLSPTEDFSPAPGLRALGVQQNRAKEEIMASWPCFHLVFLFSIQYFVTFPLCDLAGVKCSWAQQFPAKGPPRFILVSWDSGDRQPPSQLCKKLRASNSHFPEPWYHDILLFHGASTPVHPLFPPSLSPSLPPSLLSSLPLSLSPPLFFSLWNGTVDVYSFLSYYYGKTPWPRQHIEESI